MSKKYKDAMNKIVLSDDAKLSILNKLKEENPRLKRKERIIKFAKYSSVAAACVIFAAASFSIYGKIEMPKQKTVSMDSDIVKKENVSENDNNTKSIPSDGNKDTNNTQNENSVKSENKPTDKSKQSNKTEIKSQPQKKYEKPDNTHADNSAKSIKENNLSDKSEKNSDSKSAEDHNNITENDYAASTKDASEETANNTDTHAVQRSSAKVNEDEDFLYNSPVGSGGGRGSYADKSVSAHSETESNSDMGLSCSLYDSGLPNEYIQTSFSDDENGTFKYTFANDTDTLKLVVSQKDFEAYGEFKNDTINNIRLSVIENNELYKSAKWHVNSKYYYVESEKGIEKNLLQNIISYINDNF